MVAMANSGGGILVFGANSDGSSSEIDCQALLGFDLTVISSKVFRWTGYDFTDFETLLIERGGRMFPALIVGETDIPIPFSKPGEWERADGRKKVEFAEGTVYFRRGAKSAPGTRADLGKWIERYATAERKRLMQGMRKIVAAPPGHVVATVSGVESVSTVSAEGMAAQLSNDPKAIKIMPRRAADFYPHRGLELRAKVNAALHKTKVNSHDITSINRAHRVFDDHPEFATKPHDKSAPQYSDQYANWLIKQINDNPNFLSNARDQYAQEQRARANAKKS
jgi:hypothetical protein